MNDFEIRLTLDKMICPVTLLYILSCPHHLIYSNLMQLSFYRICP